MVRFNLYKACFLQLQMNYVKIDRLCEWLSLDEYESDIFKDSTKQAFDVFADYCSSVMNLRRTEVIEERRIIDTTVWPLDTS